MKEDIDYLCDCVYQMDAAGWARIKKAVYVSFKETDAPSFKQYKSW